MSRVGVLQSVRFFWTKRCQVTWAALTVAVHTGQPWVTFTFSVFRTTAATHRSDRDSCQAAHSSGVSRPSRRLPAQPRLRRAKYAIERIIHHYGVPGVVSSSCLFPTISYFHTGVSHLAFLQDRFIFPGNTYSVVSLLHSKTCLV